MIAFKLVLLVKPLSAAAERVFSLLNNSFDTKQESALEDYIHLSVMMQYNNRKSKGCLINFGTVQCM